jgi:hypothetical protein
MTNLQVFLKTFLLHTHKRELINIVADLLGLMELKQALVCW